MKKTIKKIINLSLIFMMILQMFSPAIVEAKIITPGTPSGGNNTDNYYTVTIYYNDGTNKNDYFIIKNNEAFSKLPTPTREKYSFEGWYTAETGGVQYIGANGKLTSNASATNFQTDGTLYAHWSRVMAENISYDNTNTGANCSDVQCMLDLIAQMIDS